MTDRAALARKPIEAPPAARADPALKRARPVRALDETARRLNARPTLVAQRALAERLGGEAPVQLMPQKPGEEKEPQKKRKRGKPGDRKNNVKTKKISREIIDIREGDSDQEEDRKDTNEFKKSPRKKVAKKKVKKKRAPRKTIIRPLNLIGEKDDPESDYSDSEGEADKDRIELAKEHGVENYTKKGRKKDKRIKKVRNKVDLGNLQDAKGKLNGDAKSIQSKATSRPGAVVVTTALLFHPNTGKYKKFAFTNGPLMKPDMRIEAEQLGYHVVKAPPTHAESQMIQYLYVRSPVYVHEDMGVDRDHCDECHIVMKTYFGTEDYGTHANKSQDIYEHYHASPLLHKAVNKKEGESISKYRDEKGDLNEVGTIAFKESQKRRNKIKKEIKKNNRTKKK